MTMQTRAPGGDADGGRAHNDDEGYEGVPNP